MSLSVQPTSLYRRLTQRLRAPDDDDAIEPPPPPTRFDLVIEITLIILLVFMPAALGAVATWSRMIVIAGAGVIAVTLALKWLIRRDVTIVRTWAYLPVALLVGLALLQLVEMPTWLARILSPQTVALRAELLGSLPDSASLLSSATLSVYPYATRTELWLLISYAAIFIAVLNVFRRREQIRRLLLAIALVGGASALLALAQHLTHAQMIYWSVPIGAERAIAGSFLDPEHFGQFMNLSIGAAIGLMLVRLRETSMTGRIRSQDYAGRLNWPEFRIVWILGTIILLGIVAIVLSMSRTAVLSMIVALPVTMIALGRQQRLHANAWVLLLLAVAAFVAVLHISFDGIHQRWASSLGPPRPDSAQILDDSLQAWASYPLAGMGLGTFPWAFPMYDSTDAPRSLASDNEYARLLLETGTLGVLFAASFLLIVLTNWTRNVRRDRARICTATFGLGYGLVTLLIHSWSDQVRHVPANALLAAVFCGSIVSLARIRRSREEFEARFSARVLAMPAPTRLSIAMRFVTVVLVAAVWVWILAGADSARQAHKHWSRARTEADRLESQRWAGSHAQYTRLIGATTRAAGIDPGNVEYRYWLNFYRWRSITLSPDPPSPDLALALPAMTHLEQIVNELYAVIPRAPTYGPSHILAGQLLYFVLDEPAGAAQIRTGHRLAPNHAVGCFNAALLDIDDADWNAALANMRRCMMLDPDLMSAVVRTFQQHHRPELAVEAARDDAMLLLGISRLLEADQHTRDLSRHARLQAMDLLIELCHDRDTPPRYAAILADLFREDAEYESAVEYYRQALSGEYSNVHWRVRLAHCLLELDRVDEALREASFSLVHEPDMPEARKLMETIHDRRRR